MSIQLISIDYYYYLNWIFRAFFPEEDFNSLVTALFLLIRRTNVKKNNKYDEKKNSTENILFIFCSSGWIKKNEMKWNGSGW